MNNEQTKLNFDMSKLSLKELIEVYEKITEFLEFLNEEKVIEEEKVAKKDE